MAAPVPPPTQSNSDMKTSPPSASDLDSSVQDIEKQDTRNQCNDLERIKSHDTGHEIAPIDIYAEAGDEIYKRFTPRKKNLIVVVLSFCGFLSPVSSTAVLSAVPEVAATFDSTSSIINLTNALYLIAMGICPLFFGPISTMYGRRWPALVSTTLFTAFSIGTALSPNLVAFFFFRVLTALQGTSFLVIGTAVIGDIYRPVERSTALSWFLSGALVGPAVSPVIGGVLTQFCGWRTIFWLQTALAGTGAVLVVFGLPETSHHKKIDDLEGMSRARKTKRLLVAMSPTRVITLFRVPNLIVAALASSALVWNMYSLLTPIRHVLNARFGLSSPAKSGLFYLAPGAGYVLGTFFGGRWADHTVKRYIKKRGERVAEDRLRSTLPFIGIVIPGCMLVYGWSVEKEVGGIALPVIVMFLQGVAQLFCFPSLNVYCIEVLPKRSADTVAGNYMTRYFFAAAGTAVVLPAIESIGVGWFSTVSACFLIVVTGMLYATIVNGKQWRERALAKKSEAATAGEATANT